MWYLRSHNRYRVRVNEHFLKCSQVKLPQSLASGWIQNIIRSSVVFGVIRNEMLRTSTNSLTLNSIDQGRPEAACKKRILAEVLEVAATTRVSVQIHSRAHNSCNIFDFCLATKCLTETAYQIDVPCGAEAGGAWEADCRRAASCQDIYHGITRVDSQGIFYAVYPLSQLK